MEQFAQNVSELAIARGCIFPRTITDRHAKARVEMASFTSLLPATKVRVIADLPLFVAKLIQ